MRIGSYRRICPLMIQAYVEILDDQRKRIFECLSAPDPSINHNAACRKGNQELAGGLPNAGSLPIENPSRTRCFGSAEFPVAARLFYVPQSLKKFSHTVILTPPFACCISTLIEMISGS